MASLLRNWNSQYEQESTFKFSPEIRILNTRQNFDHTGKLSVPTDFNSLQTVDTAFKFSYGFTQHFYSYGEFIFSKLLYDTKTATGNMFGLSDQTLGLGYRLGVFDFQLQGTFPAYSPDRQRLNKTPILGDGSRDITFGFLLNVPLNPQSQKQWIIEAGTGLTSRSASFADGYGSGVPWSLGLHFKPVIKGFNIAAKLQGFKCMTVESTAGTTIAPNTTSGDTGGSFIYGALRSSYVGVDLKAGIDFSSRLHLYGGYFKTLKGTSAPAAQIFTLALDWRLGKAVEETFLNYLAPQADAMGFINYGLEAQVVKLPKTESQLKTIRINKGSLDGVEVGQIYDIFNLTKSGAPHIAIARAIVSESKTNESQLTLRFYFREIWIEEGFIAKKVVQ